MRIEVLQISCGVEDLITETDDQKLAARAYRYALQSPCGGRIRVDGKMLTITEADQFAHTDDFVERKRRAKQGQAQARKGGRLLGR